MSAPPAEKAKRAKRARIMYVPPWFRLYHEIADDPKLSRLSETRRWRFIVVLVMNHRGLVPCDDAAAAYVMRIPEREARATRKLMTALGLVTGKWISPAFLKRQRFSSDHSTDRVRRHRQRVATAAKGHKNEPSNANTGNGMKRVTVTVPEEIRAEEKRQEADSDKSNNKINGDRDRDAELEQKPMPSAAVIESALEQKQGITRDDLLESFFRFAQGKPIPNVDAAFLTFATKHEPTPTQRQRAIAATRSAPAAGMQAVGAVISRSRLRQVGQSTGSKEST